MSPRAALRLEALGFGPVFDYVAGKSDWLSSGLPTDGEEANTPRAGEVVEKVPTCDPGAKVGDVRALIEGMGTDRCVVTMAGMALGRPREDVVVGLVHRDDLHDDDVPVEQVMKHGPVTTRYDSSLKDITEWMREADEDGVLVTTPSGDLVGFLRR
jgi:CBS domain-containing protein